MSAVAKAPYKFESRPRRIDRAHFYIHQTCLETNFADYALGEVADHARGFLGPRDPEHSVRCEPVAERGEFLPQLAGLSYEQDAEVELTADDMRHSVWQRAEDL